MKPRHIIAGSAIAGLSFLSAGHQASAWGNGCLDGIKFPNEQSYYAYLSAHPNALVDVCTTVPPTTTPRSVPPSTSATTSTTTASTSTTTTASASTVPPETTPSTDSSTPSTLTPSSPPTTAAPTPTTEPQPGAMCETISQQNSEGTGTTSGDCAMPSSGGKPTSEGATSQPSSTSSASSTALPKTGADDSGTIALVAVGAILTGGALVYATRRRP